MSNFICSFLSKISYMQNARRVARAVFLRSAGVARALHYGAAAGASAGGRAKPAAARALNRFFARGAIARLLEMLLISM